MSLMAGTVTAQRAHQGGGQLEPGMAADGLPCPRPLDIFTHHDVSFVMRGGIVAKTTEERMKRPGFSERLLSPGSVHPGGAGRHVVIEHVTVSSSLGHAPARHDGGGGWKTDHYRHAGHPLRTISRAAHRRPGKYLIPAHGYPYPFAVGVDLTAKWRYLGAAESPAGVERSELSVFRRDHDIRLRQSREHILGGADERRAGFCRGDFPPAIS